VTLKRQKLIKEDLITREGRFKELKLGAWESLYILEEREAPLYLKSLDISTSRAGARGTGPF
jgi:hypothetical protein